MHYFLALFAFVCIATISILGLQGTKSDKPPLYIFPDMDFQAKYLPQASNDFFKDHCNDRPVVPYAVQRGYSFEKEKVFSREYVSDMSDHPEIYTGKTLDGQFLKGFPVKINEETMLEGQRCYKLFCQVCHGALGDGNGITKQYGMVATASYHDDRIRQMAEGEIFDTITHGKNTMGAYADKLSPQQRWAVIAYIRALQRASNATILDVPDSQHSILGL